MDRSFWSCNYCYGGVLILAILCTAYQNIVLTIIFHFVIVIAKLTVLVA